MSRTDKDAPTWVRALSDPTAREHHAWLCEHSSYGIARPDLARTCDINNPTNIRDNRCARWTNDRTRSYTGTGPGVERLHTLYYGPERSAVRDTLRNALRDYNAHGDTDIETPDRQTRNSDWYGGWWD